MSGLISLVGVFLILSGFVSLTSQGDFAKAGMPMIVVGLILTAIAIFARFSGGAGRPFNPLKIGLVLVLLTIQACVLLSKR
jgi:hypothetical protein